MHSSHSGILSQHYNIISYKLISPQDKVDDVKLGLKSTAILFNDNPKTWLSVFGVTTSSMLLLVGLNAAMPWPYYTGLGLAATHLAWQVQYWFILY